MPNPYDHDSETMTIAQASKLTGIGREQIRKRCELGELGTLDTVNGSCRWTLTTDEVASLATGQRK